MDRRLTPKGRRRRAELLDHAAARFAADGFHATSVNTIVDGLGVGKGVFYWYFDSKDDLFRSILTDAQRSLRLAQRDAVSGEPDPARRIELGIRSTIEWLGANRDLFTLLEAARTEERFAPLVRHGDQQTIADALPHVKAGIMAGLLRREDPVILTTAIWGVTVHLARVLMVDAGLGPDRVAAAAIAFCRQGFLDPRAVTVRRRTA